MLLIYSLFFIITLCSFLQIFKAIENGVIVRFSLIFIVYFLVVIAGLNTTSPDYDTYTLMFKSAAELPFSQYDNIHGEFIFLVISGFIYEVFGSQEAVFTAFSFFSVTLTVYLITKNSKYVFISVLIYMSHAFLNKEMIQIRAGIASALVLLAITMQARGKDIKAILAIIVGSLFHVSSLIAIVPLILCKFIEPRWHLRLSFILLLLSYSFYLGGGVDFIVHFLDGIGLLPSRVSNYLEWDEYNFDLGLLNPNTLKQVFILLLAMMYFRIDKEYTTYFCFFYITVCWLIAFSSVAIIGARVSSILSVSELILVPAIIYNTTKNRNILGVVFILIYATMFIVNFFHKNIISDIRLEVL